MKRPLDTQSIKRDTNTKITRTTNPTYNISVHHLPPQMYSLTNNILHYHHETVNAGFRLNLHK